MMPQQKIFISYISVNYNVVKGASITERMPLFLIQHLALDSKQSSIQAPLVTDLWFLWCCLIDFRQETLQLGPVAHQLVVDPVSFIQQGIDVGHSLHEKNMND